jgi:biopolymer transport protein ExbD
MKHHTSDVDNEINMEDDEFLLDEFDEIKNEQKADYDMTPMTDLAFLLLTFFMITTTFAKPQIMDLIMPEETENESEKQEIKESQAMHILIPDSTSLVWYTGLTNPQLHQTSYSEDGIQAVLQQKKDEIQNLNVLIKPGGKAIYKNVVDIISIMNTTNIQKYSITDLTEQDRNLISERNQ